MFAFVSSKNLSMSALDFACVYLCSFTKPFSKYGTASLKAAKKPSLLIPIPQTPKICSQKYKDGSLSHISTLLFCHTLNKLAAFLYLLFLSPKQNNSIFSILKGESSRSLSFFFKIYNIGGHIKFVINFLNILSPEMLLFLSLYFSRKSGCLVSN